jgi:hypothetical protein
MRRRRAGNVSGVAGRSICRAQPCPGSTGGHLVANLCSEPLTHRTTVTASVALLPIEQERAAAGRGGWPARGQLALRKPRSGWPNWPRLGKTVGMFEALTPNHLARVAEYSSTEVEGIQRPSPVSSGPLIARLGIWP